MWLFVCRPPYASPTCNANNDWHTGQVYIGVFGAAATSSYAITAYESVGLQQLIDGQPVDSVSIDSNPPIFVFQVGNDALIHVCVIYVHVFSCLPCWHFDSHAYVFSLLAIMSISNSAL